MQRYLITTADERSWVFDRPILFLGEWCRRYHRKLIWSTMDAIVAEPYGLEPEQQKHDLDYVLSLTAKLLLELMVILNELHQVKHTVRYWNIVLGHWLRRYVQVAYNRYQTLTRAFDNYDIVGTRVLTANAESLLRPDSLDFIFACNDDYWNHVLYSKILASIDQGDLVLDVSTVDDQRRWMSDKQKMSLRRTGFRAFAKNLMNKVNPIFSRASDAVIMNSYLPTKEAIKLQLSLKQCPQFWQTPMVLETKPDFLMRQSLIINRVSDTGVDKFICGQIKHFMPTCYLEGYQNLVNSAHAMNWPKRPKFIFTSNNFDTDEVFKAWTGAKIEQGITYLVGQHGNNYGTLESCRQWPELTSSDKFITWGWQYVNDKTIPAFIFKTFNKKQRGFDPKGGLLLIECPLPHRLETRDSDYEYSAYQAEQFKFVCSLPSDIHKKLTVRLHHTYKILPWYEEQRWQDQSPQTNLEMGKLPLNRLMASSRLVVHSYDSTGILETLSLDIPTLCFWQNEFVHLTPEAKPYYQRLKDVGIFQDSPEKAAQFIGTHWADIDSWWQNPEVQKVRQIFCRQYARSVKNPLKDLKKILLGNQEIMGEKDSRFRLWQ